MLERMWRDGNPPTLLVCKLVQPLYHFTDQAARRGPLLSPRGSPGDLEGSEGLVQCGVLRPAVEGTPGAGAQKPGWVGR